ALWFCDPSGEPDGARRDPRGAMKWLVLLLLAGCDKVFLGGIRPDASTVDDDANPIVISAIEFANPMPIASLNTADEEDRPTLTDDMLELYFHRTTGGLAKVFVAKRDSLQEPFRTPAPVDLMPGENLRACISGDGLRIAFTHV